MSYGAVLWISAGGCVAKKARPSTMNDGFYEADARSFTKGTVSKFRVAKDLLTAGEKVLIIDDFMAHGEASMALTEIVGQAGGKVIGIGAVIEKGFQGEGRPQTQRKGLYRGIAGGDKGNMQQQHDL